MHSRTNLAAVLASCLVLGCGGGPGGGSSAVTGKEGPALGLNPDGPKNGANPEITGTSYSLLEPRESSEGCQGAPPILPEPSPAIQLADTPQGGFDPVSEDEVRNLPPFSFQGYGHVALDLRLNRPSLDLNAQLGKRVLVDSLRKTFTGAGKLRSRSGEGSSWIREFWDLNAAEKLVVVLYPMEAIACRTSAAEAQRMTEEVFPGHSWDEDNTRVNAFRHAYWNMVMCFDGSTEFAKAMGDAHEIPRSGESERDAERHNMDLHNNAVGRAAFSLNRHRIGSMADGLAVLFGYIAEHPYEYFDGRPNPPTAAPVYLEPKPAAPVPGDVVISESQTTSSPAEIGFYKGGTPKYWWDSSYYGQGGHMLWTYSNGSYRDNYGLWRPDIPETRMYEVAVFVPANYASTKNAKYVVHHAEGFNTVAVSQYDNSDRWVILGTYRFERGPAGTVELWDDTGEPVKARWIGFDSVKWSPR